MSDATKNDASGTVLSLIRSNYEGLSAAERKLADHILRNPSNTHILSIANLALETHVSEATVVRFARKLGFGGFLALKRSLLTDMVGGHEEPRLTPYERFQPDEPLEAITSKLFSLMRTALNDTYANLEPQRFAEAVELVAHAERVEAFGIGGSGYIAFNATNKFVTAGVCFTPRTDPSLHAHYARFLGASDVALALSHTGKSETVEAAIVNAAAAGARTVAITSNAHSAIARAADVHILTAVPEATVGAEAGVIRVAQVAVLDCLAVAVAHQKARWGNERRREGRERRGS